MRTVRRFPCPAPRRPRTLHQPRAPLLAALLVACAAAACTVRAAEATPDSAPLAVRILGTGEIHATPDSCDCPLNPVGGLANLARLIHVETARDPARTLLVDTGGFVAGGSLDSRSAGPVKDLARSRLMLDFLRLCPYRAIALGNEELALGRDFFRTARHPLRLDPAAPEPPPLPFTCANLRLTAADRAELGIAFKIPVATPAGAFWIAALAPPGSYAAGADGFEATDPNPVLRLLLSEAAADPTHPRLILLSHLGDAATDALLSDLVKHPGTGSDGKPVGVDSILAVMAGHHRPAEVRQTVADTPILYVRGEGQYLASIAFHAGVGFPQLDEIPVAAAASPATSAISPPVTVTGDNPAPPAVDPASPAAAEQAASAAATAAGAIADRIRALISTARPQLDFTFATDCPHCLVAVEPTLRLVARFEGHADIHLRFMVHRTADGRWITGIQPGRAAEEKSYQATRRLLIVGKYAPDKVWALFQWVKNNPDGNFDVGLRSIGFPAWRLKRALEAGEDQALLEENLALTEKRQVPGTPAVYIDGQYLDAPFEELRIASSLCAVLRERAADPAAVEADLAAPGKVCSGVPRCFEQGDCKKPGYITRCLDAGKPTAECRFIEDQPVTVWVVQDPDAVHSNAPDLVTQLGRFFAKMHVAAVDVNSDLGRQIVARTGQATLPIYVVKNLRDAVNQADVEKFGRYVGDWFVLQPLPFYSHDHFTRPRALGTLDIFYEVHSPNAAKAILRLESTLALLQKQFPHAPLPRVRLQPLVYLRPADPDTGAPEELIARGGLGELEQSARLLAVADTAPDKLLAYAAACAQAPGSTYWRAPLQAVGLDPVAIAARARQPDINERLHRLAVAAQSLRIEGDVAFLVRNQELDPIQNGAEMWQVLTTLQKDLETLQREKHPLPAPPEPEDAGPPPPPDRPDQLARPATEPTTEPAIAPAATPTVQAAPGPETHP
ncbi:MAG: hypothetical protein ACREJ2_18995 [Planctomycetota bacterium]